MDGREGGREGAVSREHSPKHARASDQQNQLVGGEGGIKKADAGTRGVITRPRTAQRRQEASKAYFTIGTAPCRKPHFTKAADKRPPGILQIISTSWGAKTGHGLAITYQWTKLHAHQPCDNNHQQQIITRHKTEKQYDFLLPAYHRSPALKTSPRISKRAKEKQHSSSTVVSQYRSTVSIVVQNRPSLPPYPTPTPENKSCPRLDVVRL